ncbi:hypothetical protein PVAP13_9NG341019 [Panicum virgatum]|uniref:Uncharacterized protein n=1 Tax=Panicum virgatum TaxID=38727 RepID=A0A8T0MH50_PANVG|nr:hypothetical protein PVAP13_9NG341019 [Panicum virgatum]
MCRPSRRCQPCWPARGAFPRRRTLQQAPPSSALRASSCWPRRTPPQLLFPAPTPLAALRVLADRPWPARCRFGEGAHRRHRFAAPTILRRLALTACRAPHARGSPQTRTPPTCADAAARRRSAKAAASAAVEMPKARSARRGWCCGRRWRRGAWCGRTQVPAGATAEHALAALDLRECSGGAGVRTASQRAAGSGERGCGVGLT